MAIRTILGKQPQVDPTAFVEESAQVVGEVSVGAGSSLWFNAVARGDINSVRIGAQTNIQDLCCLHVTRVFPVSVGDRVTVGHNVTLHGCTVGDDCLVGMGSIVLDGAEIGAGSFVAAGSLVTPGTKVPPGSLVLGSPAKVKRPVGDEERATIARSFQSYVQLAAEYARAGR
ncbi:MAG TPA: gamma carbonic anhydrase family protein [Myxococcales bacterium]|jgi:carbonic anhydrase/acetyltransferase-like protein (isoleucine patch superfamily)